MRYENIDGWFYFHKFYDMVVENIKDWNTIDGNKQPRCKIVEIGTWKGKSAAYLAERLEQEGLAGVVDFYTVDTFEGSAEHAGVVPEDLQNEAVTNLEGLPVTVVKARSDHFSRSFGDETVDVVFIDGDHSFEGVRSDILAWWPKLRPGGLMGGDDWLWSGNGEAIPVQRALHHAVLYDGLGKIDARLGGFEKWPFWYTEKPPHNPPTPAD